MDPPSSPYDRPLGNDAIRLFQLTTSPSGCIQLNLERFFLSPESATSLPPFLATSYVWGTPPTHPADTPSIILNGTRTPILESAHGLFRAMLMPRNRKVFPPATTWWWMDCVCINQADIVERSAQVPLMSTIYRLAARTIIWLGEASADSDLAIQFLRVLSRCNPRSQVSEDPPEVREGAEASWQAVARLLERKWWERVWTLQEFLIGDNGTLFCGGDSSLTVNEVFKGVGRLWDWHQVKPSLIPRESYEKAWNRLRLLEWYAAGMPMPLVAMMAYTSTSRVSDPRDRIYSLLGLATEKDQRMAGQPDYRSDAAVLYARFAKSFVETYQSLDIVCVARALGDDVVEEEKEVGDRIGARLASWVPDWSLRRRYSPPVLCMASQSVGQHIGNFRPLHSVNFSCSYVASGNKRPKVTFSEDLREMTCAGVFLDYIDGLGGLKQVRKELVECVQSTSKTNAPMISDSDDAGDVRSTESRQAMCSLLFDCISRCLVLDRIDRYFRHPAPRSTYSREFRVLCQIAARNPADVYPTFSEWFKHNKNLRIGGITLEEAIQATASLGPMGTYLEPRQRASGDKLSELSQDIYAISGWRSFLSRSRDTTSSMGKRLIVTNGGLLGMAPREARKGDLVCVLLGCSIPLVLREVPGEETFTVVGECYVDGYMNGEVCERMEHHGRSIREFCLI
ncbi:heterokaryon incompatibility protein-domain-containing protein [Cercophora scortea]|uniref:Heterokaryon incompatibility protein-domain-containing protein n=1 Tax=Cercophora scortea TaxID=314031 RepID=A0AAE0IUW9_9PEZI|nr:heterokaryon incompatibility protein-domain-containing protein [Cercophora scortea]